MSRLIFCLLFPFIAIANDTQDLSTDNFNTYLEQVHAQALEQGVSTQTLAQTLGGLNPNPRVIELDRSQAEFSQNFWRYLPARVSPYRLKNGKKALQEHQDLLQKLYQQYGVPPHVIVAFWGLESNFGNNTGNLSLVRSLATLGFDARRSEFFTRELLVLLSLIDQGKIPSDAKGSWAGAMGGVQFMPSNVAAYGVDANGDGKIDLWHSKADIFASAANFLQALGWQRGYRWGREVTLPEGFDYQLASLQHKKPLSAWQVLGVRQADGSNLPIAQVPTALVLPMGYRGPAFLVYANFRVILKWNRSLLYALSVGHLSDRLAGAKELLAQPIIEPSLSRDDIHHIQTQLNTLGFDAGEADGISGPKTRQATRDYQQSQQLPIDGYVGRQLLEQLQ